MRGRLGGGRGEGEVATSRCGTAAAAIVIGDFRHTTADLRICLNCHLDLFNY